VRLARRAGLLEELQDCVHDHHRIVAANHHTVLRRDLLNELVDRGHGQITRA
jgi:hypothetical protein